jgi:hypothetical protein
MAKLKNFANLHGFAFAFLALASMCPGGNALAPAELHGAQVHEATTAAADPAANYQLRRQKLMQRIEALGKEGAGITAYKAALEAIDKKSNDGVDENQLILDLEKLGQEVAEQEQDLKHIKDEEAHPSAHLSSENASGS